MSNHFSGACTHRIDKVVTLTIMSLLAAPEVVRKTVSVSASDAAVFLTVKSVAMYHDTYTTGPGKCTIFLHYDDVIMGAMASHITSLTIVYSTVYSGVDQCKHQSSASLAFVWGIHRGPVNSPHKWPVTQKMFPFDDVIMCWRTTSRLNV